MKKVFLKAGFLTVALTSAIFSIYSAQASTLPEAGSYAANIAAANRMFQHDMYDRNTRTQPSSAFWLRASSHRSTSKVALGLLKSDNTSNTLLLGSDIFQRSYQESYQNGDQNSYQQFGRVQVGVMAGYGHATIKTYYDNRTNATRSRSHLNGYTTGIYGNWQANATTGAGIYLDTSLQYSWFEDRVSSQQAERYNSKGWMSSIEAGYGFIAYEGVATRLLIEPHGQFVWSNIEAEDHIDSMGNEIEQCCKGTVTRRAGIKLYMTDKTQSTGKLPFRPIFNIGWRSNSRENVMSFNGERLSQDRSHNVAELKLGVVGNPTKRLSLSADIGTEKGSSGYHATQLSLLMSVKL